MIEIDKYLDKLKKISNNELEKNHLNNSFSDFEKINYFLINKAINEQINLFIKNTEFQDNSSFYEPLITSIALSLFMKNYCEDKTTYEIGDILIDKKGNTLEIIDNNSKEVTLKEKDCITRIPYKENDGRDSDKLKTYIVTNKNELSNKKLKVSKINEYRKFFKDTFNLTDDYVPSKFLHKAVIILEKKDFHIDLKNKEFFRVTNENFKNIESKFGEIITKRIKEILNKTFNIQSFTEELKKIGILELCDTKEVKLIMDYTKSTSNILKQIPTQWITKSGNFEETLIPIEPMIYLTSDYESFKENMFQGNHKIETVILIGKNKYKDYFYKINRDIRENNIKNVILIGTDETDDIRKNDNFIKWRWTYDEYAKLNNFNLPQITTINIKEDEFSKSIKEYDNYIKKLERDFSIDLKNLRYNLYLYSNVFNENDKKLRIKEELEHQKNIKIIKSKDLINSELFNQNKESNEYESKIEDFINKIFQSFENNKYKKINNFIEKNSTLIVPDELFEIWNNFNKIKGIKVLSWKNFKKQLSEDKINKNKNITFLSLFGYEKNLICKLKNTSQNYFFITYPEEAKIIKNIEKKYQYFDLKEYKSIDRKKLTDIEFVAIIENFQKPESEDILLEENFENEKNDYANKVKVDYKIYFDDNDSIVLDGDKSIILENNSKNEKIKVYKLRQDDFVRIYINSSKEKLFERILSEDKDGEFLKIDQASKIWKKAFLNYQENLNTNIDSLLIKLEKIGCSIKNTQSLKKWLDLNDKEKFPKSLNDLKAIRDLVKNTELDINFDLIKKSKTLYRGIMISLGRILSDEITDYIIDGIKGANLNKFSEKEINSIVNSSAKRKKIIKIEKTEEEEND